MAKEFIEIGAKTTEAEKAVKDLTDDVKDLKEEVDGVGGGKKGGLGGIGDGAKDGAKGVGTLSTAFKGLGTAMKAAGIGLIVSGLVALGDAFSRNEKLTNGFKTAFNAISIVFDDFITLIVDNAGVVVDFFKDIFENPLENVKALGNAIKNNIIERFNSLLDTLGFLGEAFTKFFEGDFSGALDSVKDAGKEFVDVMTGVDGTVDKATQLVEDGIEAFKEYGKEVLNSADALVDLERNAKIAVAQQELLNKQYLRDAELQRQIRDDVNKPLQERIEANQKLGEILEKQEKAMLASADAQLALAQTQLSLNNNTENYIALLEAQANREDVLESINGFKSEQLVNEVGLKNELIELDKARAESETQLALDAKRFNAERIQDEEARLTKLIELSEQEAEIELERLQKNIDNYKEGTQARLDAEIEYNTRKQELDQAQIEYEDELEEFRKEKEKANQEARIQAIQDEEAKKQEARENTFEALKTLTGEEEALGRAQLLFKQLMAAKEQLIQLGVLKSRASAVISEASLDGANASKSIATGTAETAKLGFPQAIPALIAFGATAAGIISTVTKAVGKTKNVAKAIGGGGVSGGGGATPSVPTSSFNIVGAPDAGNQVAEAIAEGNNEPIQAFVAVNDVTDGQSLQDNIVNSATISN